MSAMIQESELQNRLEKLAMRRSRPFCMGCYEAAPSGRCEFCGSDDLARELAGEGVDWGISHVIRSLVRENLRPADVEEAFEESVHSCYEESVKIGWIEYDTVSALKELDLVSWEMAQSEYVDQSVSDGDLVSFDDGGTYYWTREIEAWIDEEEQNEGAA